MKLPVLLAALLAGHLVLGLCRVPMATVARRAQEITDYQREGDIAYAMRTSHLRGADALAELRRTAPPAADIGVSGDSKGALEFAPALLWPHLCRRAVYHSRTAPSLGPVLARQWLVADADGLHLDPP
jgi:hypothetical protein